MNEEKQKEFNTELQALLIKYGVDLVPSMVVQIVPKAAEVKGKKK